MIFDTTDALMGLAGGLMIGAAAAMFLLMHGRISGVSGILGELLQPRGSNRYLESLAFIVGIIAAPMAYLMVTELPAINVTGNLPLLIGGGLLVGLGTRLGNGCTSGHGVCGMSRFSLRSIVATMVFMVVAVVMASFVAPMIGASS